MEPKKDYTIPFPEGIDFQLGFNPLRDEWRHPGKRKEAWDFGIPEGTEILAAREGKVLDVRVDSKLQGYSSILEDIASNPQRKQEYKDGTNWIVIDHQDGTYAVYAHLQHQGAAVEKGTRVSENDMIGYSGNTGYSTDPHLHFEVLELTEEGDPVTLIKKGKTMSLPIEFKNLQPYLASLVSRIEQHQPNES